MTHKIAAHNKVLTISTLNLKQDLKSYDKMFTVITFS